MRWIYLSPHLDDAVLSCGGLIREQTSSKIPVEIWTICAGDPPEGNLSPFANMQHSQWDAEIEAYTMRRAEDMAACHLVGARYRHLPFLDCIYRQAKDGSWLYHSEQSLFGELSVEDAPTLYTLQTFLASILKPDDILVIPLTIGRHVDHQMVRIAAEGLARPVFYYADVPYVIKNSSELIEVTQNLRPKVYNFSRQTLTAWLEANQAYRSQMEVLFEGAEKMHELLERYYQQDKGLRIWRSEIGKLASDLVKVI